MKKDRYSTVACSDQLGSTGPVDGLSDPMNGDQRISEDQWSFVGRSLQMYVQSLRNVAQHTIQYISLDHHTWHFRSKLDRILYCNNITTVPTWVCPENSTMCSYTRSLHCIPRTEVNSLLTQESWILLSWVKDASHEAHMYISVFCYKCASGETYLSYLRPINLSWVKWELSSVPVIQCTYYPNMTSCALNKTSNELQGSRKRQSESYPTSPTRHT